MKSITYFYLIGISIMLILAMVVGTGCKVAEEKIPEGGSVTLRSTYEVLSVSDVKDMLKKYGFHERRWNKYSGFGNQLEEKTIDGHAIVIDHSTKLTWHQSGSESALTYEKAGKWLEKLNSDKYAGYSDWRFPTLEEAASLIESKPTGKPTKYYVDPAFSRTQHSILTGDFYNQYRLWSVSFQAGCIFKVGINDSDYVRPVRSGI